MYNIIILGIVLSIIFYELTEISPGGVIVPGYIAIYISQPSKIVSTIILSLLILLISRFLSNFMVLYGRRRFGLMTIIGFFLRFILDKFSKYNPMGNQILVSSIGYIIPAIIAQDIEKQGFPKTISGMLIVASLVKLIEFLLLSGGII